jgi:ketosteroid isomerase-like protein
VPEFPREEVERAVARYRELRRQADAGEIGWDGLCEMFTEDAVFIDPAWGRVEGLENIRQFMKESMAGLEDWKFPIEWTSIDGDKVVVKWQNRLPGRRADGSFYDVSGISNLIYAGGGRFSYEEDHLNMVVVNEVIRESRWRPLAGFNPPPAHPKR